MSTSSVRRARDGDADELTRLRAVMLSAMGQVPPPQWWAACPAAFRRRLADTRFAAFVVDAPDGGLAAAGCGWVEERLPGVRHLDGLVGIVASVATDPAWRRRGLARAVCGALLEWFDAQGVERVELMASTDGDGLYRGLGFVDAVGRPLVRQRGGGVATC